MDVRVFGYDGENPTVYKRPYLPKSNPRVVELTTLHKRLFEQWVSEGKDVNSPLMRYTDTVYHEIMA